MRAPEATAQVEASGLIKKAEKNLALTEAGRIGVGTEKYQDRKPNPDLKSGEKGNGAEESKSFDPNDLPHNQQARKGDGSEEY